MKVIKYSGDVVDFNIEKLRHSLAKSGASTDVINEILIKIEQQLFDGIRTKQIYKQAFALLKKSSKAHAARYNLRSALQMLGPAGFFFEKYVARLYNNEGYESKTNLSLQGQCVTHEVDVAIKKDSIVGMVECKFHNSRNAHSDVKVPMYILSRLNDLNTMRHNIFSDKDTITTCTIVTNNRFTADAVTFAKCSGIALLSWDFPLEASIRYKIDNGSLYPITCLTTLSMVEKERLMILDILLVKDIINQTDGLQKIGISPGRIKNVLKEASELSNFL